MPNNKAEDRYNPPAVRADDFETVLFSEIEVDDLFWLKENGGDNPPYRKTTDTQAGNTKTRVLHNFDRNQKVFQRI